MPVTDILHVAMALDLLHPGFFLPDSFPVGQDREEGDSGISEDFRLVRAEYLQAQVGSVGKGAVFSLRHGLHGFLCNLKIEFKSFSGGISCRCRIFSF